MSFRSTSWLTRHSPAWSTCGLCHDLLVSVGQPAWIDHKFLMGLDGGFLATEPRFWCFSPLLNYWGITCGASPSCGKGLLLLPNFSSSDRRRFSLFQRTPLHPTLHPTPQMSKQWTVCRNIRRRKEKHRWSCRSAKSISGSADVSRALAHWFSHIYPSFLFRIQNGDCPLKRELFSFPSQACLSEAKCDSDLSWSTNSDALLIWRIAFHRRSCSQKTKQTKIKQAVHKHVGLCS